MTPEQLEEFLNEKEREVAKQNQIYNLQSSIRFYKNAIEEIKTSKNLDEDSILRIIDRFSLTLYRLEVELANF